MVELFFILLVAGLMLFGAEIFVPGGILGTFAGLFLLGAIICGFIAYPAYGGWIAVGILCLVGVAVFLWIKIFPGTPLGRSMTVLTNLADSKGTAAGLDGLVGKQGIATSDLRPGGFAEIDGKRCDVITEGGMIDRGRPVVVTRIGSNRVVVREATEGKD